jgi:hypothetical protein
MALEQMEGFELAGRTVRFPLHAKLVHMTHAFSRSYVLTQCTRRAPQGTRSRILWMKLAVCFDLYLDVHN